MNAAKNAPQPPEQCPPGITDCPVAKAAAEFAVKRVFAILGVDVDIPKDVEAFRENLRFGRSLRTVAVWVASAVTVMLSGGIAVAFWAGIVGKLTGA